MKTIKSLIFISLFFLPLLSCVREELQQDAQSSRTCMARINIEGDDTKVSLTQQEGGLDLIARWKEGDKILVFLNDGKKYWALPETRVRNITSDGKGAVFYYELPEDFRIPQEGYKLYCFTPSCHPVLQNKEELGITASGEKVLVYNASIVREALAAYSAPVMYSGMVKGADNVLTFKHYLAYEVLHVKNNTSSAITYSHNGFNPENWYKQVGSFCADNSGFLSGFKSKATQPRKDKSTTVTIPAGGTARFVSAYVPNGNKLHKAQLVAGINGSIVTSANTKTSYVTLQTRRAYHLYATWDGDELKFDQIEADPAITEPVGGAIDLGLSVRWAGVNVGAMTSTDPGHYFAWGEVHSKEEFTWDNYAFGRSLSMYNGDDGITILRPEHDAVHFAYGGNWRLPTQEEWDELRNECDWSDVFVGEQLVGYRIASRVNSNFIVLPIGGFKDGDQLKDETLPRYWSKTRAGGYGGIYAWSWLDTGATMWNCRYNGMLVRGVYDDSVKQITPGDVIDLGLSVKWAGCNVGASACEELGHYYAWGEVEPQDHYTWDTYLFGHNIALYNGTDGLTRLDREHDVAYQQLGGPYWRMPSQQEWDELKANCNWISCTVNGQWGFRIESNINGNSIFLPTYGFMDDQQVRDGMLPRYWSSTLAGGYGSIYAWSWLDTGATMWNCRYNGMPIRAVYDDIADRIGLTEGDYIDMGLSVDWARCNMGAPSPEERGSYYAWGELTSKMVYSWENYAFGNPVVKYNGTDGLTALDREDDVVYARQKTNHRMPTQSEWDELWANCDAEQIMINGRHGYVLTSRVNQNKLFLPLTGFKDGVQLKDGMLPRYWSSTLAGGYGSIYAWSWLDTGATMWNCRYNGMPVRGVRAKYETAVTSGEMIDLGLSVKWASVNVGASVPEDIGEYYAWGETVSKDYFTWENYSHGESPSKYSGTDGRIYLDWKDDVVHTTKGGAWRMPTQDEWDELKRECDWTETTLNGVRGFLIASRTTGNSIFLPLTGFKDGVQLKDGMLPRYWSNTLAGGYGSIYAWSWLDTGATMWNCRYNGMPVRGVYDNSVELVLTEGEVVDMGLSVDWASRNIGAFAPEEFGLYFGWGEVRTHTQYSWATYAHSDSQGTISKYNGVDGKTVLDDEDDAARRFTAGRLRMPSQEEWDELMANTTKVDKFKNGRRGYLLTSTVNGNTLFLPFAGFKDGVQLKDGTLPRYWSNTLAGGYGSIYAWSWLDTGATMWNCRYNGMPVRGVRD